LEKNEIFYGTKVRFKINYFKSYCSA